MPSPAAQVPDVKLTELQTKVLHALLKPVGDLTSQKQLEYKFPQRSSDGEPLGEPDPRLSEAIFALWEHKLIEESTDLKRHYCLTLAGRRLQRQLAPVKPTKTVDSEEDTGEADEAPKARARQDQSKGNRKPAGRSGLTPVKPKATPKPPPTDFDAKTEAANERFAKAGKGPADESGSDA